MKKIVNKLIILIIIAMLLMPCIAPFSYATDTSGGSWVLPDQQRAVAMYTQKFVKEGNARGILLFSQNRLDRIKGYNLETTSNEYGQFDSVQNNGSPFTNMLVYDSGSFVATMYHQTLGMELSANENARDNIYTVKSFLLDAENKAPFNRGSKGSVNNFGFVGGKTTYSYKTLISMADAGKLLPGDLIVYDDETHILMYLGKGSELLYEELIIDEAIVEDEYEDRYGVEEGEKLKVTLGENAHYCAHAGNTRSNIEISALELLEYIEFAESTDYYVLRPKMTEDNGITVKHQVNMDILWPDSSYSTYTKLGVDPVTGKRNEYYYVGIPTTEEYYSKDNENGEKQYEYIGSTDAEEAINSQKGNWLVRKVQDVISWFTGYVGIMFRGWAVGWTSQIEKVVSDTIQSVGSVQREIKQTVEGNEYAISKDNILNVEDIVYNRVPLFDANVFNTTTIAGVPIRNRMPDEEFKELKEKAKLKGIEGVEAREKLEKYYNSVLNTMSEVELKELEEEAFAGDEYAMERLEEYRKQTNPILVIRKNVANMYYAIRNIAIVGLLLTLIYIGVRMAITTIAEQKAKYKQTLVNWCVSLVIVFMIHYIMVFIMQLNEALVKTLPDLSGGISFYEKFREMAYSIDFMDGWIGTIMYMVLLVFTIKYIWIYIKRFFTLCILTIAAPVIGIGYAIDKIKDNKSQSLSRWLRNYVFNVIIQFIHAILYTVLMSVVYMLLSAGQTFPAAIFACVFLNFMTQSVKIVQNIFKIDANTLKNTLEDIGTQMAGVATIAGLLKTQAHLYGAALKVPGKITEKVFGETVLDAIKYKHVDDVHSIDFDYLGDDDEIRKKFKEEDAIREKLERQRKQKIKEDKSRRRANREAQMQYAKNIMSMGKGLAYAAAAIPTTVISPKAGIAMMLTARNTYSKSKKDIKEQQSKILGYDVDKFKGRFSMRRIMIGTIAGPGVIGIVETAKEQIRAESKQHREAQLYREDLNESTNLVNQVRDKLQQLDEIRHGLQKKGQFTEKEKLQIELQMEILTSSIKNITDGKTIDNLNGTITVELTEELVKEAFDDYKKKNSVDSITGQNREEAIEYVAQYAQVNIPVQRKIDDMKPALQAQIVKQAARRRSFSSYRTDEDPANRYRDPRQASSLLEDNKITDKQITQCINKTIPQRAMRVSRINEEDVSKMAEKMLDDIENKDSLTDSQRQDIMQALECKIQEKVEDMILENVTGNEHMQNEDLGLDFEMSPEKQKELDNLVDEMLKDPSNQNKAIIQEKLDNILTQTETTKVMDKLNEEQMIKLISGKTKIETPQEYLDTSQSSTRLNEMRKQRLSSEGNSSRGIYDANELVNMVKQHKP